MQRHTSCIDSVRPETTWPGAIGAGTGGQSVRSFRIDVSATTDDDAAFTTVFTGQANDVSAVQEHLKAKQLFERAAKSAQDPELRAFAKETLPVIDHHYQMAENLQRSLKSAS